MTASPTHRPETDSSIQLPSGALPPPVEPRVRLTRGQWWYVNKWVVVAIIVVFGVLPGLWAASSVPVISTTHSFHISTPTQQLPSTSEYFAWVWIDQNHGGTLSGTFWAPNSTVMSFFAMIGSSSYALQNVSSGSFHVSTDCNTCDGNFLVYTLEPVTVYVNGTNSFLAPLI